MTRRRLLAAIGAVFFVSVLTQSIDPGVRAGASVLPDRLSSQEFWSLSSELSEADGFFRSDNLLSNEVLFQHVIPDLTRTAKSGRVYLGVGPEQNFTYIAALKPTMAFIVDIRRGNLQLHLMYKAIFEMSADRIEFVSRLFSRKRPDGLGPKSTAQDIFAAFTKIDPDDALYKTNLKTIQDYLVKTDGLPLSEDDLKGIDYVYSQFCWYGPIIQYWSSGGRGGRSAPTYTDLMLADDGKGQMRGYLASDDTFAFLRDLHKRNMLVPVVGNFAGPKALRSVGKYIREHGGTVSAFYLSNVEQYLGRDGLWATFCGNVATLPLDDSSTFIRSVRNGNYMAGIGLDSELGNIASEVKSCSVSGGLFSNIGAFLTGRSLGPSGPPSRFRH